MIKREDITSQTVIDYKLNQTKLLMSISFGSIITFEGIEVPQECISGEADEQRTKLMQHIYGDIDRQLAELHAEIARLRGENSEKFKLLNMVSGLRSKLQ